MSEQPTSSPQGKKLLDEKWVVPLFGAVFETLWKMNREGAKNAKKTLIKSLRGLRFFAVQIHDPATALNRETTEKCLIVFLLLLALSLTACGSQPLATESVVTPFTVTEFVVTPSVVTADWLQVYFTNPADPMAEDYAGGPNETLADAIGIHRPAG